VSAGGGAIDWPELERRAVAVRRRAHAPYSGYHVGAALLTRSGAVFAGCNVENASYGLCLCAERSAVAQMVAAGARDPVAIAVATRGPSAGSPCGMCRQVLAEFALDLPIRLLAVEPDGPAVDTTLEALLPMAFRGRELAP
jgi:cytidine deaminase